jgi:hypothetical protein
MRTVAQFSLGTACQEWLIANLGNFGVPWEGESHNILRRLQMYAELVLLAVMNHRAADAKLLELQNYLIDWLSKNPPDPDALAAVVKEFPQSFIWAGTIWQNCARMGIGSDQLRQAIESLARIPSVLFFERHVGHEICVYNILNALQLKNDFNLTEAYSRTMLARQTWNEPSDTVLYFLCHDVFYLSDWGTRALRNLVQSVDLWIAKMRLWFERCARSGNADLAAELAIALSYLGESVDFALMEEGAAESLRTLGLPQSPKGQGGGYIRPGDDESLVSFFRHYHTVLVCLMALLNGGACVTACEL